MKKSVRWLALICALLMTVSLVACGEKKEDEKKSDDGATEAVTEPVSDKADFEWVKFEMPEGWADANESDAYVTVREEADDHHVVKLFKKTYVTEKDLQKIAEKDAELDTDRYHVEEPVEIGGVKWIPERFTFNDKDSVKLFGDVDGEHYVELTIYEQTETAPAVQTILNSLEFDTSKF